MNEVIEVKEVNTEEVNLEEINPSLNKEKDEEGLAVTIINEAKDRPRGKLVINPLIQLEETDSLENDVADEHSLDWLNEFENQEIKPILPREEVKPISLQKEVESTTKRLVKIRKKLLSSAK